MPEQGVTLDDLKRDRLTETEQQVTLDDLKRYPTETALIKQLHKKIKQTLSPSMKSTVSPLIYGHPEPGKQCSFKIQIL